MRLAPRPCQLLALLLPLWAAPLVAQNHRHAIGYGIGLVWFTDFNDGGEGEGLGLDGSGILNAHAERWLGAGRIGLRLHGAVAQPALETPELPDPDITTWFADANLLFRLNSPHPQRIVVPFLTAGIGLVHYDLGEGAPIVIPDADAVYPGDDETHFAGVFSAGFDILPGWRMWDDVPIGFRIEVADHIVWDSPFEPASGGSFGTVHNIRVTLGIQSLLGEIPPRRRR